MQIDLSAFHAAFFDEAHDHLETMEASLLRIESEADDEELLNEIFRAAHSIKGASGTFGFHDIGNFTHVLENLLDHLRQGNLAVNSDLVGALFESLDVLTGLVAAAQDGSDIPENIDQVVQRLHAINADGDAPEPAAVQSEAADCETNESPTPPAASETNSKSMEQASESGADPTGGQPVETAANEQPPQSESQDDAKRWKIFLRPATDYFQFGQDALLLLRELAELGRFESVELHQDELPPFDKLEPESCHLAWTVILQTNADQETIQDVFMFLDDDSQLTITPLGQSTLTESESVGDPTRDAVAQTTPEPTTTASETEPSTETIAEDINEQLEQLSADLTTASDKPEPATTAPSPLAESTANAAEPSASQPTTASEAATPAQATPAKPAAKAKPAAAKNEAALGGRSRETIRVDRDRLDKLINQIGELVIGASMVEQDWCKVAAAETTTSMNQLGKIVRDLQEMSLSLRMVPIAATFQKMTRIVRDLSNKLGKKINFESIGEETELDKTVVDSIGDPLIHMIRNSVDHGIESPEERIAAGKPAEGTVTVHAYHQGGNIYIRLTDDGKGLNVEAIRKKALSQGVISEGDELSHQEICDLIFHPGLSTAEKISDVSGRGVGMDVVRRNIAELKGSVGVHSEPGKGSTITVRLPLTLAIMDGLTVRLNQDVYIIPLLSVIESFRPGPSDVKRLAGKVEVVQVRGEVVPLVRLHRLFGIDGAVSDPTDGLLVLVDDHEGKFALLVDDLLGQQQVVTKNLEANFQKVVGVAGATILGDGRIALILDIAGLTALKPALPMPSEEAEQLSEITETQAVDHPANPDESLATSTEPDESTTNNPERSTPQHTWA
ncbi:Chemotaxis protein CheA [Stieleria bergensis]|uniref:Chemotaxis protein CheA n=1 Tax=Stieleria bergensis TaxID=2528025 RepID=A0A517SZE6_9BACT|nr:Chemotaxis protein CheA [Planctomycetes bacterium SV_7m_r]